MDKMALKLLLGIVMTTFLCLPAAEWQGVSAALPEASLRIRQVDNPDQIGDIYIIQAPDGTATLVDTGCANTAEDVLLPALAQFGVKRLAQVIISHQHDDHIGGLPALLADPEIEIGQILWSPIPPVTMAHLAPAEHRDELPYSIAAQALAARRGIPFREVHVGDVLDLGQGVSATVLAVARPDVNVPSYVNNNSIVFRLQHGDFSMLFTGDQCYEEEEWLLGTGAQVASDILKVGHHGGNRSTGAGFLDAVHPKVAVTTSPAWVATMASPAEVTAMLQARRIPYFRSWEYGTLTICSDGRGFHIVLK